MRHKTVKTTRATIGRGLFYSRDSGGRHEQPPAQYVKWVKSEADKFDVQFNGSGEEIEALINNKQHVNGDIYFDFGVAGNLLSRPALVALKAEIRRDPKVTHVFVPRRDRLARPDHALNGSLLEKELREMGITLIFFNLELHPR